MMYARIYLKIDKHFYGREPIIAIIKPLRTFKGQLLFTVYVSSKQLQHSSYAEQ